MRSVALDGVGFDIQALRANLRGAFVMLEGCPNYGQAEDAQGELLCEVGQILIDARARLDAIYEKLDGLTVVANGGAT